MLTSAIDYVVTTDRALLFCGWNKKYGLVGRARLVGYS